MSPSGALTSSFGVPSGVIRLRKPSSMLTWRIQTVTHAQQMLLYIYIVLKDTYKLVFCTLDVGDVHVVGRGTDIFL
jgi:hypothetical protein